MQVNYAFSSIKLTVLANNSTSLLLMFHSFDTLLYCFRQLQIPFRINVFSSRHEFFEYFKNKIENKTTIFCSIHCIVH